MRSRGMTRSPGSPDLDEVEDMPDDLTELYQLDEQETEPMQARGRGRGLDVTLWPISPWSPVQTDCGARRMEEELDAHRCAFEVHAFSDAPRGLIIAGTPAWSTLLKG